MTKNPLCFLLASSFLSYKENVAHEITENFWNCDLYLFKRR